MITSTLGALVLLTAALLTMGLGFSDHASDQQLTLLGLSILSGAAANVLGYWALSR